MNKKTAIVIFNLGGPDNADSIRPFLFNLFNDPYIIDLPFPIRALLAKLISTTRAPKVKPLYDMMGGASPIQPNTLQQAAALQNKLDGSGDYKVFTAQRYWHPMVNEVAAEVKAWGAEQIILLPLYPQFSTTTTESFEAVWRKAAQKQKLNAPAKTIHSYPDLPGFVNAQARLMTPFLAEAAQHGTPRILFSAHGLPKKIVDQRGDPYPLHVQQSAKAVMKALNTFPLAGGVEFANANSGAGQSPHPHSLRSLDLPRNGGGDSPDWLVTYQSRVGPLEWIKPYTEDEIRRAGTTRTPLVIVPIAFVSDHLETLVELDIEYRHVAEECGVPYYGRVPTVFIEDDFITSLKDLILSKSLP